MRQPIPRLSLCVLRTVLAASLCFFATGCGQSRPVLAGDDRVLVRVGDSKITQYDLDRSIERTFGDGAQASLDQAAHRKVLDSLVKSRALAQACERELDSAARAALERRVESYREELLVRQYLAKHAPPEQVPAEMIEQYYRQHPERFGGGTVRRFELISSERPLNGSERDNVMRSLAGAASQADWSRWVYALRAQGMPLRFTDAQNNEQVLHPKLRALIASLGPGQASQLTFLQGQAYVVRVTSLDVLPARPLSEVRDQIRETLAPTQIKRSLEKLGADVLSTTEIEYVR